MNDSSGQLTRRPVRKTGGLACLMSVLAFGLAIPAGAASPQQVQKAMATAKEYLFQSQKNGNWEKSPQGPNGKEWAEEGGQWGGVTAIATYALLASGEKAEEPHVHAAVEWLKKADLKGIYAIGMRAQVWTFLTSQKDSKQLSNHDRDLLMSAVRGQGDATGFFDYLIAPGKDAGRYDHSVSQYGVLGMWACAEFDLEISSRFWQAVETGWMRDQDASGGWSYYKRPNRGDGVDAPMTAAGVATLFITQDFLHSNDGIDCRGNIQNPNIEAGIKWLSDHFNDVNNAYTWYGIERIGVASGYKYFGTIDWYQRGADWMVQNGNNFDAGRNGDKVKSEVANAALHLLFLSRGSAPVMMNKLNYELDSHGDKPKVANWNERTRDAANVTKWVGKQMERFLNWQIVNLNVPVEELHDAPILYISGNQALDLKPEHDAKLRQFAEQGGLILLNADCSATAFSNSVMKPISSTRKSLATRLFPTYEIRKLPADHIIFSNEVFRKASPQTADVYAVGNGTREMMIIFNSGDPGRYWQTRTIGGKEFFHQVMANLYAYTTDMQGGRIKGETHIVTRRSDVNAEGTPVKIARLEYGGNWDPEPGGWRRLDAVLHNEFKVDLDIKTVKLGDAPLDGFKIAHLTGNVKFSFSESQRQALQKFTSGGGLLVVDACGGAGDFATSAEAELKKIFGAAASSLTTPLPMENALFSAGRKIEEISYRRYAMKALLSQLRAPRVRSINRKDGTPMVYYSAEDLSAGLVGQDVDGILGYSPATATAIMRNIILQANGSPQSSASAVTPANETPVTPNRNTNNNNNPNRRNGGGRQPGN